MNATGFIVLAVFLLCQVITFKHSNTDKLQNNQTMIVFISTDYNGTELTTRNSNNNQEAVFRKGLNHTHSSSFVKWTRLSRTRLPSTSMLIVTYDYVLYPRFSGIFLEILKYLI